MMTALATATAATTTTSQKVDLLKITTNKEKIVFFNGLSPSGDEQQREQMN